MKKRFTVAVASIAAAALFIAQPLAAHAVSADNNVYGDALVNGDTQHTSIPEFEAGQEFNVRAELDGSVVKEQIENEKQKWNNPLYARYLTDKRFGDKIELSNTDMKFQVTITEPAGLVYPTQEENYVMGPTPFYLKSVTKQDGKVTMMIDLDISKIKTFADLYDVVVKDPTTDLIFLDISGVKLTSDVPVDTNITSVGEIVGDFKSTATVKNLPFVGQMSENYNYHWDSIQDKNIGHPNHAADGTAELEGADGTDAAHLDSDDISFTVKLKETPQPTPDPVPNPNPKPDPSPTPRPNPKPSVITVDPKPAKPSAMPNTGV